MLLWSRRFLRLVSSLLITLAVLSALLLWRLANEPISLKFLAPYLAESLVLSDLGMNMEADDVVLAWSETDHALRLRVLNARVRRENADLNIRVPEVDIALSGASLLRGVIAPRYIRVAGLQARLVREVDGRFLVSDAENHAEDQPPPQTTTDTTTDPAASASATGSGATAQIFAALFNQLSQPTDLSDPLGQLDAVSLEIDRLVLIDRKLRQRWVAPKAVLNLVRGDEVVSANFSGNLDWRGKQLALDVNAEYSAARRSTIGQARFEGVEPADFADLAPILAPLDTLHMPLSGRLDFTLDARGSLGDLRFDLAAGAGQIEHRALFSEVLSLQEAKASGRLETSADGNIEALRIEALEAHFTDKLALSLKGWLRQPEPGRFGIEVKGRFVDLPTDAMRRYWPQGMAKNARDWAIARIRDGRVTEADSSAEISPDMLDGKRRLPREAIVLNFDFDGLSTDYFPPLTKITNARGKARLDADTFSLTVAEGRVGPLTASGGKLLITGLQDRDQFADITITAQGRNADMLELIDRKPLGYPTQLGIKPASVAGDGRVTTTFRFPLDSNLKLDDVKFTSVGDLSNVALPELYDRFDLTNGSLKLRVDAKGLEAQGEAELNTVPTSLFWRQEFDAKLPVQARYRVSGRADDTGRKALGFDLAPYIAGPLQADAEIESHRNGDTVIQAKLDLSPAILKLDELYYSKPADKPAQADLSVRLRAGQPIDFEALHLRAPDFDAQGRAMLAQDDSWEIALASLSMKLGSLSGHVKRAANGDMDVKAEGKRFDLTRFMEEAQAEPPQVQGQAQGQGQGQVETAKPRLDVRLRFDQAKLDDKTTLRDFALDLNNGPFFVERLDMSGAFLPADGQPGGGSMAVQIAPKDVGTAADGKAKSLGRSLKLRTDNAGAMFQFLGIENMHGGSMEADGSYADDQPGRPLTGSLTARNFKAVRTPFLARLLGIGSFTGLANLLSGEGIQFETASVPFRQAEGVLTIQPSRIQGPQLGITLEGSVDRRKNHVNVTGTAVPAFVLNTILGRIPVLGDLFVGDGIIGVNFAASGPRENIDITVNPLSAIAPGFLRRIFQAPTQNPAQAPVTQAPATQAPASQAPAPTPQAPAQPPASQPAQTQQQ